MRQPEQFGRYLGLSKGSSLCFVIDTTGSMSDDIKAVKEKTLNITAQRDASASPPSDYVLSLFNDPGTDIAHAHKLEIRLNLSSFLSV